MKTLISIFVSALLLAPQAAPAGTVYRCMQNGKPIFTDEPGPNCEPLNLQVIQPNPEDVARMEEKKRLDTEQERARQEQMDRERMIRAQEDAARAAEQQAEAQRRLVAQRALEAQRGAYSPSYYPGFWPGLGYPLRPIAPGLPPPPPFIDSPVPPNYPYGADRIGVGGGRGR